MYRHGDEWKHIDSLVFAYQKQFEGNVDETIKRQSREAMQELLNRFYPLFKKYLLLFTTGHINYSNTEQRAFVRLFMGNNVLKKALFTKRLTRDMKHKIEHKFNFVVEGYGNQTEEEMYGDMYLIVMTLAKRYKDTGRSFCCYVYNLFKYEMFRVVQAYQENPANIHYKVTELNDESNLKPVNDDYSSVENGDIEDEQGIPTIEWIRGETCNRAFQSLNMEERMVITKYYLQNWSGRQVADLLGVHENTANQKRKNAIKKLCQALGKDRSEIQRYRNSKKKQFAKYRKEL